jgi:ERF superfamily
MGSKCETTKPEITTCLAFKDGMLCVVAERANPDRPNQSPLKLWYPIREAQEAELSGLIGRSVTEVDEKEGIYVDEEGAVFQLAGKGDTKPILDNHEQGDGGGLEQLLSASLKSGNSTANGRTHALQRPKRGRKRGDKRLSESPTPERIAPHSSATMSATQDSIFGDDLDRPIDEEAPRLNLRQKLAEVRRRIGYIQKRGFNERNNYSYVTAADLAGAVGDILAELGVVIIPCLESITYEPNPSGRAEVARSAQVVMSYTFTDVDTGEAITAKVAGQGLDSGDKAPYKAMTGALKYALLQSFLLATGDDPEEERINQPAGNSPDRTISSEQVRELKSLIDETDTELDRVLSYYRVSSLEELRESGYRRAIELLNRKRAKHTQGSSAYAQD